MKFVLSGYMGSGKSEVGRLLAADLNIPFYDLDQEIERRQNLTIKETFETKGEIFFRRKEAEVLAHLLESDEDFVLALGGGTPCYGRNIQTIKEKPGARLVYLKTSLTELTKRLFREREKRPLISHLESEELLEDFIRKHLFERTFYYNQSNLKISTDEKTPGEISEEIKLQLN